MDTNSIKGNAHPTNFRRTCLGSLILAILAIPALAVDLPIARWFHTDPLPGDLKRLVNNSEFFGHGLSVALLILAVAWLDGRTVRVAWRLIGSAFLAGISSTTLKLFVARLRPTAALHVVNVGQTFLGWLPFWQRAESGGYSEQSFPSSHTATAVGLAVGLAALYPRGQWVFIGMASLAALQRLAAEAHFLSDVLMGAALGWLVAGWWTTRSFFWQGLEPTRP